MSVAIELTDVSVIGDLAVPDVPSGVVVFAHGSGSSRFSPRNRSVAAGLNRAGLATLLIDLLTPDEEAQDSYNAALRFDVELLTRRLVGVVDWLDATSPVTGLPIGVFGASTGAAAALGAAALRPTRVAAVVSRGGRPDLAGQALDEVRAPVLLVVGGRDPKVLDLNQVAMQRLPGHRELEIVPGAGHLFEESGAMEHVTRLAVSWFRRHLVHPAQQQGSTRLSGDFGHVS